MKNRCKILLVAILVIGMNFGVFAQIGTGKKADGGSGKYVGAIYWLSFGRDDGTALEDNDKAVFTTPQGLTYTIVFSKVNATDPAPKASLTTGYSGNNFPSAYSFTGSGKPETIGLRAYYETVEFDLTLTVSDGTTTSNYGNIVIAGTESLNGNESGGVKTESYSLRVEKTTDPAHQPSLNVIETYIKDNNFSNLALKVDVEEFEDGGKTYEKLTVTNPQSGNSKGDALLAATNVHKIRATVKSTDGGQHFAIGVLDLGDRGDLPKSFEYKPGETEDGTPDFPAVHINAPVIVTPNDVNAHKMLSVGTHYFVGEAGKTHFTDANGIAKGDMATLMKPMLRIGTLIDFEETAKYSNDAKGDDTDQENDEDGVETILVGCKGVVGVYNNTNAKAYLHYWIDLNENGHFEANEHGETEVPANHYNQTTDADGKVIRTDKKFFFDMQNVWATTPQENHNYFARFRLSTVHNQNYFGLVDQGEVEDYVIQFIEPTAIVNVSETNCSGQKGKVTINNLPQTGWKLTLSRNGQVYRVKEYSFEEGSPSSYQLTDLVAGSYELVVSYGDPSGCSYTKEFSISTTETDSDGDGLADDCEDLDDDNDGILDTDEGYSKACVNVPNIEIINIPNTWGTPTAVTFSKENVIRTVFDFSVVDNGINLLANGQKLFVRNLLNLENNLTSNPDVAILEFSDGSLMQQPWVAHNNSDMPRLKVIIPPSGEVTIQGTKSKNATTLETMRIRGGGTFNTISFSSSTNNFSVVPIGGGQSQLKGKALITLVKCTVSQIDTDADGVPNHLDLDSDNDGCPDALEGGTNDVSDPITEENLKDKQGNVTVGTGSSSLEKNLGNAVDEKGVPINVNDGQSVGVSTKSDKITNINLTSDKTNHTICEGEEITLTATPEGLRVTGFGGTGASSDDTTIAIPEVDYKYKWYEGTTELTEDDVYSGVATKELKIKVNNETYHNKTYRVAITTPNMVCGEEETLKIKVNARPKFEYLTPENAKCYDEFSKVKIKITSGEGEYVVKLFKEGSATPVQTKNYTKTATEDTVTFEVQESGTYSVKITYKNGNCVSDCGE